MLLDKIIDYQKEITALYMNAARSDINGISHPCFTTTGWSVLVRWKDGPYDWNNLKYFKDSYPVELAKYPIYIGIEHKPAF